jgi:hypothetical protein
LAGLSRVRECGDGDGGVEGAGATLQVAMVCLDELVPEDCRYRKLDGLIDWSFVRGGAESFSETRDTEPKVSPAAGSQRPAKGGVVPP